MLQNSTVTSIPSNPNRAGDGFIVKAFSNKGPGALLPINNNSRCTPEKSGMQRLPYHIP